MISLIFLIKVTFIAIGIKKQPFCPRWHLTHLFTYFSNRYLRIGFNNYFIMDMSHNRISTKHLH